MIHADGGLIYAPLRREAENTGQLRKFDQAPTQNVRLEEDGLVLTASLPRLATAYDVLPKTEE